MGQRFLAFTVFLVIRREWAAWPGYVAVACVVWWGSALNTLPPAVVLAAVAVGLVNVQVLAFLLVRFGLLGASGLADLRD